MNRAPHVLIAPSLLSADFANFAQAARAAREAGAELLHFDVMDGVFVPNITFGAQTVQAVRHHSDAIFDVHLMIVQPERYIEQFAQAGADIITVHVEACVHLQRTLSQIRECGVRAGVALNPATPLSTLEYVLPDIDLLLVMTVNPGFGGQQFIPEMLRKIARARAMLDEAGSDAWLEVDGGINGVTTSMVVRAGARVLVAGSSVFGHPDGVRAGVQELREAVWEAEERV
ncbi:MAG: ribulose-phosphate 3-epimerase [Armatimonadota bacterium]|nr:ribulose-phosphate 3-epimerase [bacterium]MDW8319992.1 ribulose-phosphate 3-epimerase [Armatimonadota bacterium]